MNIFFNNKLETLYGIDYCVYRNRSIIKQSTATDEASVYYDEFYRIFLEKTSNDFRDDVLNIGDYRGKAEFVLEDKEIIPDISAFSEFFIHVKPLQERIVSDISSNPSLSKIDIDGLRSFFGIDDYEEINVVLSMFINSCFAVFNGSSNIVVGVKYDSATQRFVLAQELTDEIYHDLAYPYVRMTIQNEHITLNDEAHRDDGYLEELLSRVVEIILASRMHDESYIEEALSRQDQAHLGQARIFLSEYLGNRDKITNFEDFIAVLQSDGLISRAGE